MTKPVSLYNPSILFDLVTIPPNFHLIVLRRRGVEKVNYFGIQDRDAGLSGKKCQYSPNSERLPKFKAAKLVEGFCPPEK